MSNEDMVYQHWLRTQRCCNCGDSPCSAHRYSGFTGSCSSAHDQTAFPLCVKCHHDIHAGTGDFKGLDPDVLDDIQYGWMTRTRVRYTNPPYKEKDNGSTV